jgi:hypothetical protein
MHGQSSVKEVARKSKWMESSRGIEIRERGKRQKRHGYGGMCRKTTDVCP